MGQRGAPGMPEAVFFDAAGTLFVTAEPVGHTYARIARKHGLDACDDQVSARFRRVFSSTPGLAFGPGHAPADLRRLERLWWARLVRESFRGLGEFDDFDAFFGELFGYFAEPTHWQVMPEALDVLGTLRAAGTRLGIISNFDYRLHRILDGLGLAAFFDSVTVSSEAGFAKPAREIFLAALERMGVSAIEAVHVGDSERVDPRGAEGAGLAAVLLDPKLGGDGAIVRGRSARVASLASLIRAVQLLRAA